MRRISRSATAIIVGSIVLSACGREPAGQVAAVVGDDEITLQEINAEIGNAQLPKGTDVKQVQQAALQRIIDRKLLADVARDQELDKKPEYLIRQRQLGDALLVQQLGEQAGRSIRVPEGAMLDKYVAAHPATFAKREILQLDQIRFQMPADPQKLRMFEDDHSMDAVADRLKQMGIEFQRGNAALDTAVLEQSVFARLEALPAGEPFVIPQNGFVSVSSIVARKPAPLIGDAARPVAAQLIRNQELSKVIKQRLEAKKAEMTVKYQNGFAPPKSKQPGDSPAAR